MNKTILIIEDNLEVRENIQELLELDGFKVVTASNGREGVKIALNDRPSLILCDIMMPELDGYGVLKILSRNDHVKHIPFLFLTAKVDKSDIRKGMGLGADDYITKPFNETELLDAVHVRIKKGEDLIENFHNKKKIESLFLNHKKVQQDFLDFVNSGETQYVLKKDEVYKIGQYSRYVFFIMKGVLKCSQICTSGKELIVDFYKSGDTFGYSDYKLGIKSKSSIIALTDCELKRVPVDDYEKYMLSNKDFVLLYSQKILKLNNRLKERLVENAFASLREKVARALIVLSEEVFVDQAYIEITRGELASFAGLAKETVIRTLSELKSENIISISGQKIEVIDKFKLASIYN